MSDGADWIRESYRVDLSPLGVRVADLLDGMYQGIYHLDDMHSLKKVEWSHLKWMDVSVPDGLATYDGDLLTRLVILCHDKAVRCEILGIGPRWLRLRFHPRTRTGTSIWMRHPTIHQAVKWFHFPKRRPW